MTKTVNRPDLSSLMVDRAEAWKGKFPKNGIISLLDTHSASSLAESTASDLTVGQLVDMVGWHQVKDLKLGYGSSAGNLMLREQVAQLCAVLPDEVLITQGAALGLFLLAFELCRADDEVVLITPYF